MRICVPTAEKGGLDDRVGEHFGRSPTYTIYDTDTGQVEVLSNVSKHMGGKGHPAELLARAKVDVVICSGLGRRALMRLKEHGIQVYSGAFGTARDAIQAWQTGRLSPARAEDTCAHHQSTGH